MSTPEQAPEVTYTALLSTWPDGHESEHRYPDDDHGRRTAESSGATWRESGLIVSCRVERRTRRALPPYPWCFQAERCAATERCEARWSCGD